MSKSDNFFHSVKIKSDYFDNFIFDTEIENQPGLISTENDAEYKKLITIITQSLIKKRKAYLKKASQIYIEKLINEKAYPCFNESNIIDSYKREQLDAIVEALYIAEPKLFASLNTSQKKVFIRLLNTIMSSDDKESLFKIVDEVVELEDDERKSFADLLSHTTLANIISTIKIIEDRTVSVQALKEIVFNKTWNAYEVQHVQKVMERHFWLIGEQYHLLTSAEPDFNEALRRLLDFKKENVQDAKIDHEDANKEMDIFLVKQDKSLGYFKNIVVELKRPSIKLGEKELSQVKRYMRVIQSDDRFNSANSQWVYYLIGNKFDTTNYIEGEIKNNVNHGENGLVYNVGNHKIFVKKWSEVFEEWETRSQFLLDKLKFSKSVWMKEHTSADDAVNSIIDNSASIAPYKM